MLKRITFSFALLLLLITECFGQQSTLYSQYVFNRLAINPAYAGSQDQLQITTLHRRQWDNFEGAPVTNTIIAHKAIKDKKVGIGLIASDDRIGIHSDQRMYVSYAYKIKMMHGTLAMGLQAGFSRLQSDFSKLNLKTADAVATGFRNSFNPNFGTGLYYSNSNFFAGLSIPYLLNSTLADGAELGSFSQERRYYFLTAGRVFTLNPLVKVLPSVLVRVQEGNATSAEVGANLILNDILTVGASYRSEDALIGIMKLEISKNISAGYSYDHTLSDIGAYSNGSHEFMLSYRIPYSKKCHTYF
ncbi:PorP/SprF family type IX secretion system membrane protein [Tunicatimonas pelagia]|uniref:PorP/SprF family type IX secretion system membrane protein n=1 Tax=Tunicatimonas pelagia TaxID=931531 RepID=UPI002665E62D|nr:type IX secretion system membrane protein PorP/SprF [Tunicatimonas pelagia]WKN43841.1 type IX secretion system membrane protein PorP/SprF [Tunicatimonas pelagia]